MVSICMIIVDYSVLLFIDRHGSGWWVQWLCIW